MVVGERSAWRDQAMPSRPTATTRIAHLRVFTKLTAIEFVAAAFERAYPTGAAKSVANDIHCSHRTSQKWIGREVAPSLHHFLTACQAIPELNAAMRELLGMGQTDAGFQRALSDFIRAAQAVKP
jgi:hypothetical protein